jgi:hypothetical protein
MLRVLLLAVLLMSWVLPVQAGVKTVGHNESLRFDSAGFTPEMKAAYGIMQAKCTQCHSLERTVIAVTTGVAPISGRPFDHAAVMTYGQKMLRMPNARMSKEEVKSVVDLLSHLLESDQPGKK